jgi:uncharacterized protein (DUF58 family)
MLARVKRKRGDVSLPFQLEYRHIYVMPTAFGAGFGFMLLFMALGGLNFNNNMALLLVFALGSIAQMTTLLSYRTLVGLKIDTIRCEPVFAGEHARFVIYVSNAEERERLAIQAALSSQDSEDGIDLAGISTGSLSLNVETTNRGWQPLPSFRLETRYPLGMFRAWTWFFPRARCIVYPRPATRTPPLPRSGAGSHGKATLGDGEQVHGLRAYREGDSLKRVAWRTSARHDQLFTREMETPQEDSCVLSWDLLQGLDTEARLAVLTAWVLQADHRQLTYSLKLPGLETDAGNDAVHRAACLEQLALYGL